MDPDTVSILEQGDILVPRAPIVSCPIEASLGLFGKKWTLLILRDIAMRKKERFNELSESLRISPRILSRRLRELESNGLISRTVESSGSPKIIRWRTTEKAWDALPILFSYVAFGSKYYPEKVFTDRQPRSMKEQYPSAIAEQFFVSLDLGDKKKKRLSKHSAIRQAAKW